MFNTYPNIFVMLHADSGMKKGPPVNVAKRLVKLASDTRVISGRSSIQGILKKLGTSETSPTNPIPNKKSVAFICSSELTSSIVDDKAAMDILTDLYDRSYNADTWESLLKMEQFNLVDPTITMLTATNEAHSTEFFSKKDISGGYFARTFVIYEKEENRPNSLIVDGDDEIDYKAFAIYLKELGKLKGPFAALGRKEESDLHKICIYNSFDKRNEFFTEAGAVYENWYIKFKQDMKTVKDPTGTLNRFGSSILKVAMLLSLSEKPELIISANAMERAISECEKLVGNIRKVTFGKTAGGDSTNATRKTLLLQELMDRDNHAVSLGALLKKYWMHGNVTDWGECANAFQGAGVIDIAQNGNNLIYTMKPEIVIEYKEHFKGKGKMQ